MDLAKGIRAFISGREMILSLTVDTFITVSSSPRDESRRTYQDCAAVFVIFRRPNAEAVIRRGLGCQSQGRGVFPATLLLKCQRDQSNFLANCISFALNATRLMVLLDCVTGQRRRPHPFHLHCPCISHRFRGKGFDSNTNTAVIIGEQTPDESKLGWKILKSRHSKYHKHISKANICKHLWGCMCSPYYSGFPTLDYSHIMCRVTMQQKAEVICLKHWVQNPSEIARDPH